MEVFKRQAETFEFDVMGRASNYFCKDVTWYICCSVQINLIAKCTRL